MIIDLVKEKLKIITESEIEDHVIRGLPFKKSKYKNLPWSVNASLRNINLFLENFKNVNMTDSAHNFYKSEIDKKTEYDKKSYLLKAVLDRTWEWKYGWLGKPYAHQELTIMAGAAMDRLALLLDCGLGKSMCIINIFNYRKFIKKQVNRMLVVCPRSIMKGAWEEDLQKFAPDMTYITLWHTDKKKRVEYLQEDKDVYIINFEGVGLIKDDLLKKGFDMVVIDESSKIKSAKSQVFKAINEVGKNAKYKYISTATPTPNGAEDAWAQFYFLDGGETLGSEYKDFELDYFNRIDIDRQDGSYAFSKFVPKPNSIEKLNQIINQRSVRFRAEDCLDLPEKTFINKSVTMHPDQEKHYKEMEEKLFIELEGDEIVEAANQLVKVVKLRQITSGFIMPNDSVPRGTLLIPEKDNPKIQVLDDLLEQIVGSGNKAIIWAQFKDEIKLLVSRYKKKYGAVDYYGATTQKKREENIKAFKESKGCNLLVAHPQSLGHGITLTVANSIIYFSLDYSYENYYQSYKRIDRIGQKQKTFYYHLVADNSIDHVLLSAISRKESMQSLLIDGFKKGKKLKEIVKGNNYGKEKQILLFSKESQRQ